MSDAAPIPVGGKSAPATLGMMAGVFTPTVLTILGAIMYLREGWVVGNAGLLGALAIILLAHLITIPTGLAVASISTNIRVGAGGAYAIITQSLGLEAGGSIGIPLYVARAISVTLYVLAFAEGWQRIYPGSPFWLVSILSFLVVFGIAYVSTQFAARTQILILIVVFGSLISLAAGSFPHEVERAGELIKKPGMVHQPLLWGDFKDASFWTTFAIFFPAVTGIVAGISLSDVLEDPRKSIPVGILAAVAVTMVIYLVLAWWLSRVATTEELLTNMTVMVDKSRWGWAVLAGLLGATFSSALGSMMAAPRVLMAMGVNKILPFSEFFAKETGGEPRHAIVVTGVVSLITLVIALIGGGLNFVAPAITMFFLLTYGMLNLVVLIEQQLGMVSFRPTFKIPRIVPLTGLLSCGFVMFLVNPGFSLVAASLAIGLYWYMLRLHLPGTQEGDVRSGMFLAFAKWAAEMVSKMPAAPERTWQPNILAPVASRDELRGTFRILRALAANGSVHALGIHQEGERSTVEGVDFLARDFQREGIFAQTTILQQQDFMSGTRAAVELLRSTFFQPNILFLRLGPDRELGDLNELASFASAKGMGIVLLIPHPVVELGMEQRINVWIREQGPKWELGLRLSNLDMMLLLAYQLARSWNGRINLCMAVRDEATRERAEEYLDGLISLGRLGPWAERHVLVATFDEALRGVPQGDVTFLGVPRDPDPSVVSQMAAKVNGSCILVRDSGNESVLA